LEEIMAGTARVDDLSSMIFEKLRSDAEDNKKTLIDALQNNAFTSDDYSAIFDLCAYLKCNGIGIREFVKEVTGR
jgi:hypothetical protein